MDVGTSLETDTEMPEVVQPGMCALDDPANLSETAAVRFSAPGSGTGLLPGYLNRCGLAAGGSGSISFHSSSSMIGLPISLIRLSGRFRLTACRKSRRLPHRFLKRSLRKH